MRSPALSDGRSHPDCLWPFLWCLFAGSSISSRISTRSTPSFPVPLSSTTSTSPAFTAKSSFAVLWFALRNLPARTIRTRVPDSISSSREGGALRILDGPGSAVGSSSSFPKIGLLIIMSSSPSCPSSRGFFRLMTPAFLSPLPLPLPLRNPPKQPKSKVAPSHTSTFWSSIPQQAFCLNSNCSERQH